MFGLNKDKDNGDRRDYYGSSWDRGYGDRGYSSGGYGSGGWGGHGSDRYTLERRDPRDGGREYYRTSGGGYGVRDRDESPSPDRERRGKHGGFLSSIFGSSRKKDDEYDRDRGYGDRGYDDRGYDDRGYGDRGYGDRGYGDRGYGDKGYGDRGYGDRGYGDRSYGDRGYGDKGYSDRGYGDRGYEKGYDTGRGQYGGKSGGGLWDRTMGSTQASVGRMFGSPDMQYRGELRRGIGQSKYDDRYQDRGYGGGYGTSGYGNNGAYGGSGGYSSGYGTSGRNY